MSVRVLIVDDSAVVRKLMSELLSGHPEIEVAGIAGNGKIALDRIRQLEPDVVTLDVEMPEMNGLDALREIRKISPTLPVIMLSTLTEKGATTTFEALELGASDYVPKPTNSSSLSESLESLGQELIPKILGLARSAPTRTQVAAPRIAPPIRKRPRPGKKEVGILAIGVSTGGPNALVSLFGAMPAGIGIPVVVVQHMPPMFTRLLAERLDRAGPLEAAEAKDGELLRPGRALVAPGDQHMELRPKGGGATVKLHPGPKENSCRPAVDPLFRSVAAIYGPSALALILTGMGQDGLLGCEEIAEKGGEILVQDEASSVVWGMPGAVAGAGLASDVLPLEDLAPAIGRRIARRGGASR